MFEAGLTLLKLNFGKMHFNILTENELNTYLYYLYLKDAWS